MNVLASGELQLPPQSYLSGMAATLATEGLACTANPSVLDEYGSDLVRPLHLHKLALHLCAAFIWKHTA